MIKENVGEFTEEELQAHKKRLEEDRNKKRLEEDRKRRIYTEDDLEHYHLLKKFEEDCERDATLRAIATILFLFFFLLAFIFS